MVINKITSLTASIDETPRKYTFNLSTAYSYMEKQTKNYTPSGKKKVMKVMNVEKSHKSACVYLML